MLHIEVMHSRFGHQVLERQKILFLQTTFYSKFFHFDISNRLPIRSFIFFSLSCSFCIHVTEMKDCWFYGGSCNPLFCSLAQSCNVKSISRRICFRMRLYRIPDVLFLRWRQGPVQHRTVGSTDITPCQENNFVFLYESFHFVALQNFGTVMDQKMAWNLSNLPSGQVNGALSDPVSYTI